MKTVKFFFGALALAAVSMIASPAVNAQENGNRDENGKVVRGPYLTNKFGDNWFVSAGVGANFLVDGGFKTAPAFALDVNVGKWITPSVGVRLGYAGVKAAAWSDEPTWLGSTLNTDNCSYKQNITSTYIHADVMWNVSNAWGGYKETRFWSFVPYAHGGVMRFGAKGLGGDEEFAAGVGLLNLLRLTNRLDLTIDLRGALVNGRIHGGSRLAALFTPTVGLSVDLGKYNWVRASNWHNPADADALSAAEASAAALAAANAALAADKKGLQDENAALAAKNKALADENAKLAENQGLENVGPAAFYFEIGQTKLSTKELEHLDYYMNNVLPYVKGKKATVITGSADKKTGTTRRNQQLCDKRAAYLKSLLAEKYGVNTDDFVVNTNISAEGNPELQRAVIISFE
ncbi:MAG: hypothetical protein IJ402_04675 [Bacteroidales bacterium]|nr:hypothetical protein [Bacteroidales bacterium]